MGNIFTIGENKELSAGIFRISDCSAFGNEFLCWI